MQKAKYSPEPLSHFGLAEEHYCHFTSPIRRYPDLVVHRILKDFLNNGVVSEDKYEKYVHEVSVQSSEKEKNAALSIFRKLPSFDFSKAFRIRKRPDQ